MSKQSRYNLLISLVRHELEYPCVHLLTRSPQERDYNNLLFQRSIEAWIFLSDDLMCRYGLSSRSRDARIRALLQVVKTIDLSTLLSFLKNVYDILIAHISNKKVLVTFADFKGQLPECCSSISGFILSPIKEALNNVISTTTVVRNGCYFNGATRDMWTCSHFLQFLNKLSFKNRDLEVSALSDYLTFEQETKEFQLTSCEESIPALSAILYGWLKDWDYDGLSPKHGPGAVADTSLSKVSKYLALKSDVLTGYLYGQDKALIDSVLPFGSLVRHLDRTSKLTFVPKNFSKLRSISMEPATLQYLQQGCMRSLYSYIKKHKELKRILKLHDQTQNKGLAYIGSITNQYATIDLSHASDSVNWTLVKRLFHRTPKLYKWLLCTRSTHTLLPNGAILPLAKYAPMGSALCFPIESLIFASIAKYAIQVSINEGLNRNCETGIRDTNTYFSVFGDDIILPQFAASKCVSLLISCGFTPNDEKSYLSGPFKESCGGNYFCGYDITALKFSPSLECTKPLGIGASAYAAYCSYANLAATRALPMLRLYCIKTVLESGCKPLFVDNFDTSPGIYSSTPTNFHLKRRYNKALQKEEVYYTGVKTIAKSESTELLSHIGHILLYDSLACNEKRRLSMPQLNADIHNGTLTFDKTSRYDPCTLLEGVSCFTTCRTDYIT